MIVKLEADPLPLRVEPGGGIRVGNSRVHLEIVIEAFDGGASPESIVQAYDTLDLADVYAVVAYYLRHKDEVKAYVAERNQKMEEWRNKLEGEGMSQPNFYQELLARRARMESGSAPTTDR
jgi:uncharacterized protein (DUF433 family)